MPLTAAQTEELLRETLIAVAPGTELRDGLERILRGRTGALIVLGLDDTVEQICSGGFRLDVPFSATRLRELCKMDGAVIIDPTTNRIRRAAVQLLPDANIMTSESGTRHRTAERVAKQTGFPVISVSQSMHIVALYVGHSRYVLEASEAILSRANQALATLERYRSRLDEVSGTLSALEIEDLVTVRDVCIVIQRLEMVRRISEEIAGYVIELGIDGRLLSLQLDELLGGITTDLEMVVRDYGPTGKRGTSYAKVAEQLAELDSTQLLDLSEIAKVLRLPGDELALDGAVAPQGYRLVSRIPRISPSVRDRIVENYSSLQRLLASNAEDLMAIEGVGEQRARTVRDGLSRLAESSILGRYI